MIKKADLPPETTDFFRNFTTSSAPLWSYHYIWVIPAKFIKAVEGHYRH
jgi:hypothetical protein